MTQNKVLFTGFKKAHERDMNSAFLLLNSLKKKNVFLFTNDKVRICQEIDELLNEEWDSIIMFGQKPVIKTLRIEVCAKGEETVIDTNYDLSNIKSILDGHDIDFKVSKNAGNSYCNWAYFHVLREVQNRELKTKVLFIHVPYIDNFMNMKEVGNLLKNGEIFFRR